MWNAMYCNVRSTFAKSRTAPDMVQAVTDPIQGTGRHFETVTSYYARTRLGVVKTDRYRTLRSTRAGLVVSSQ